MIFYYIDQRCANFHGKMFDFSMLLILSCSCSRIYSCSADETCALWDPTQQTRIMRLHGHEGIVNCCAVDGPAPNLLVSGSDDGTTKVGH